MNNSVLNHEGPVVVTEVYDAPIPEERFRKLIAAKYAPTTHRYADYLESFFNQPLDARLIAVGYTVIKQEHRA